MPKAGFEAAITASEQSKTVHASDRSATGTGPYYTGQIKKKGYIRLMIIIIIKLNYLLFIHLLSSLKANYEVSGSKRTKYKTQANNDKIRQHVSLRK
jgi:hypothetical protein